ncbi:hypothetical protein NA57DRAFT_56008 [Rhizodiscina lignyota]|uniref:Uncharacterized protein n=1 Tax=Rhizodiscina lignyota TaxID=1504668 RepID=A0A9P4IFN5_9PEZI|nr:hypothetical protein NA57DRAFT_56008 [Rhizodiscina lignyota]
MFPDTHFMLFQYLFGFSGSLFRSRTRKETDITIIFCISTSHVRTHLAKSQKINESILSVASATLCLPILSLKLCHDGISNNWINAAKNSQTNIFHNLDGGGPPGWFAVPGQTRRQRQTVGNGLHGSKNMIFLMQWRETGPQLRSAIVDENR